MGRPKKNQIQLTDSDVKYLKSLMKKKSTTQTLFSRCQILIDLDENHPPAMTYDQCIEVCSVSRATIAKVVSLFASCVKNYPPGKVNVTATVQRLIGSSQQEMPEPNLFHYIQNYNSGYILVYLCLCHYTSTFSFTL